MTIEEKIAQRLREKNIKKGKKLKKTKKFVKKEKIYKSEKESVEVENEKQEINKEMLSTPEELAMPAPNLCGVDPCEDRCVKKEVAKKELNREFFEKPEPLKKENKKEKKKYKILGVMFEITRKRYYFEVLDDTFYKEGDRVIVDTARGREIGIVYMEPQMMEESVLVLPLKPVLRKASKKDNDNFETLKLEADKANKIGKEKIKKHSLPMKLVATEFTFDKSKLIFYFTAEGRIDFRDLVKELATIFKLRIELRQIGVRDEARILGNIGICGKELCCRTYINKFDSVLIKMARDQGLVINPSKISGACGRLLCCIKYEYQQYAEALLKCPSMGQTVIHNKTKGRVVGINPLNEYLYVDLEGKGRIKLELDEITFDKNEAKKQHKSKKKTPEEMTMKGLEE